MGTPVGTGYPKRINLHVPNMEYDAGIDKDAGSCRFSLGNPVALDDDGILAAQSIAAIGSATTFAVAYTEAKMGRYGRNVTVVASGAATSTVTITGYDYLNQLVVETLTLNGTTPVLGKKAFKRVTKVEWTATAGTTVNVGWGNALGLPYAMVKMDADFIDNFVASTAGTFVAAIITTPSATTGDTRGTYTPHSSVLPNGSRVYEVAGYVLEGNLHGVAHFAG